MHYPINLDCHKTDKHYALVDTLTKEVIYKGDRENAVKLNSALLRDCPERVVNAKVISWRQACARLGLNKDQ